MLASRPWSQRSTAWVSKSDSVRPLPCHLPGATLTALLRRADGAASGVTCGNMPGQLYFEDLDAEVTPSEPALSIPFLPPPLLPVQLLTRVALTPPQTYADWGIDYLKSDNCASYALDSSVRFGAMRDALNRTGHPIVLSIEPFSINVDPEQSVKVSNLWRVACDIQSKWDQILNRGAHAHLHSLISAALPFHNWRCVSADISDKWSPLAGPGGWNDPDMINIKNPPALALGENRVYFGRTSATCFRVQTGLGSDPESSGACRPVGDHEEPAAALLRPSEPRAGADPDGQ